MTAVADPTATTAPPGPAPDRTRRPRMRRPAHEPEPVSATAAPAVSRPPVRTAQPSLLDARSQDADRPDPPRRALHADDDVRRRAAATVRAMVEVLAGRRAPAHLADVARPEVVRYLTAGRTTGPAGPVAPARVHVSRPTRDAAEVVAVCRFGTRFRALALRLDREPGGRGRVWRATAVRLL